jgi:hypothetical protein
MPLFFLRNYVLMVPYLCFKFRIFNKPVLEKYVFQVERAYTFSNMPSCNLR